MNILFVDHLFHKNTKSSGFFLDLLKTKFNVDLVFLDPNSVLSESEVDSYRRYDLIVVWQLDYLAHIFISAGLKTVVVPMYDGSANMPPEHWVAMNSALIVCFSNALRIKINGSGARTKLLKYYLAPGERCFVAPKINKYKVFLWLRRPDEINVKTVETLLGDQIDSLHVHNAPDSQADQFVHLNGSYELTQSFWGETRDEYLRKLSESHIFIAPRAAEGIGMALLEAMAMGKIILAHDDSTNNEYVSNWVNGILFDCNNPQYFELNPSEAERISHSAYSSVKSGYASWLKSLPGIFEFIESSYDGFRQSSLKCGELLRVHHMAYAAGGEFYVDHLKKHFILNSEYANNLYKWDVGYVSDGGVRITAVDQSGGYFGYSPFAVQNCFGLKAVSATSSLVVSRYFGFSMQINPDIVAKEILLHYEILRDGFSDFKLFVLSSSSILKVVSLSDLMSGGFLELGGCAVDGVCSFKFFVVPENLDISSKDFDVGLVITGITFC